MRAAGKKINLIFGNAVDRQIDDRQASVDFWATL